MTRLGPEEIAGVPHWIYRLFDAADECIYIGCTRRPKERPYTRHGRPWHSEVARVDVEGPYEGLAAFEIEQELILDYLPRHNARLDNGSCLRRYKAVRWYGADLPDTPRHGRSLADEGQDYQARLDWMNERVDEAERRRHALGRGERVWRHRSRYVVRDLQEASA